MRQASAQQTPVLAIVELRALTKAVMRPVPNRWAKAAKRVAAAVHYVAWLQYLEAEKRWLPREPQTPCQSSLRFFCERQALANGWVIVKQQRDERMRIGVGFVE